MIKLKQKIHSYIFIIKAIINRPKYIKYLFKWRKSPLEIKKPWLNFDTIEWLDKNLNKEMNVFEYGSGGSTLYYSKNVKKIISVEHDFEWYKIVKNKLTSQNNSNCELFCAQPTILPLDKKNMYASSNDKYRDFSFENYVNTINNYPDNFFDLIVVGGRARNACLKIVRTKVKNNGYILLDNSERKVYNEGVSSLKNDELQIFYGPGFYNTYNWEAKIWKIHK